MMMNKKEFYYNLDKMVPNPICELIYNKDYELLIAVMLSAQTTDKRVNEVTKKLFNKYQSLSELDKVSLKDIEEEIKSIGLYKTKAKNLKSIVRVLNTEKVFPETREKLEKLSGVGRKTASVVLAELYDIPSMPVDTHVERVTKRLYLAKEDDTTLEVEKKLCKYLDKDKWNRVHKQLVLFGRYYCTSRNPKCNDCPFKIDCRYFKKHKD